MKNYQDKLWLSHMYMINNNSIYEIAEICSVSPSTIIKWLKKFNIPRKTLSESLKNKWQNQEFREKSILGISEGLKKSKPSRIISSNRTWSNDEIRQKHHDIVNSDDYKLKQSIAQQKRMMDTNEYNKACETLKNNWNNPEIRAKMLLSLKSMWKDPAIRLKILKSLENIRKSPDYIAKIRLATKLAYSSDIIRLELSNRAKSLWQNEEYIEKQKSKSKELWQNDEYKIKQSNARVKIAKTSVLESIVKNVLGQYNIESSPISLGPYTFDIYFKHNNRNILIECQGTYWHSQPKAIQNDKSKKTYFDKYLSNNYELYYIHEYEFYGISKLKTIIDSIIGINHTMVSFDFKDVNIKQISNDDSNNFLWMYHYLGKSRFGLNIGAYLNNELIACVKYTSITRNDTAIRLNIPSCNILELNRFCIKNNYHQKNFASWLLAKSIKYIPSSIKKLIAFTDVGAGHTGTIYKASNWQYDGKTKNTYWYIDEFGFRYHKKSVWDQAKRLSLPEQDYAQLNNLIKISGLPTLRFIKTVN